MKKEIEVKLLEQSSPSDVKIAIAFLFYDYFVERHPKHMRGTMETSYNMVLSMLECNNYIYYVLKEGEEVGFITMSVNDQCGMTTPHLVVDYMYVAPEYRGTDVSVALFTTAAHVSLTLGYNMIGSTLIGSSNINNTRHTQGEEFSRSYYYDMEKFKPTYERYMKRLKFT